MRTENKVRFTVVLVVVAIAALILGILGYNRKEQTYTFPIKLGLDLKGGVYVVLAPTAEVTITGQKMLSVHVLMS